MTAMEPAGIWVRVSSGAQDEANQVPDVEKHCAAHGYGIARRYTVHGKSASKGKQQPYLDQVLADMRAGVVKVLVIWHSDRIERRPGKALLDLLAEVSAAGGRVESVQEPTLGQLDFGGQVVTFIAGLVNHEKSAHLAEQVGIALDTIKANGAFHGRPPWGFTTTGEKYRRTLVPTPEGRKYAPEIFQRIADGDTLDVVARWLEAEGVRPLGIVSERNEHGKTGAWWPKTVSALIRCPTYMGKRCELEYNATTKTGKPKFTGYGKVLHRCESLVDAGLWKRANDRLDKARKNGPRLAQRAMLTSVLSCPVCAAKGKDSPMYRIFGGGKVRIAYYRCTGRGPDRKGCGNMVPLDLADAMACLVAENTLCWEKVRETVFTAGHNHEPELAEVAFEVKKLGDALAGEKVTEEEYAERMGELLAERKRLKALPATPDAWAEVELETTYADLWNALEPAERNAWLMANGFRATVTTDALELTQTLPGSGVTRDTTWTVTPADLAEAEAEAEAEAARLELAA
jgi:DNA invertase Pin-like site-specific DNA recombinase